MKSRKRNAGYVEEGNAIGLTRAFSPVDADDWSDDATRGDWLDDDSADEVPQEGDAWMPDEDVWAPNEGAWASSDGARESSAGSWSAVSDGGTWSAASDEDAWKPEADAWSDDEVWSDDDMWTAADEKTWGAAEGSAWASASDTGELEPIAFEDEVDSAFDAAPAPAPEADVAPDPEADSAIDAAPASVPAAASLGVIGAAAEKQASMALVPASKRAGGKRGAHAAHASHASKAPASKKSSGSGGRGRHAAPAPERTEVPEYMKKSRRMRNILTAVAVVLVLLLGCGGAYLWTLVQEAQNSAAEQTQANQQTQEVQEIQGEETLDASTATAKKTSAPVLTVLLGLTVDEALDTLGEGATVTSSKEVGEEGDAVRYDVRVALMNEPSDARTGNPTVYLSLDEEEIIVQAGYSTSTTSLGYGSLSFVDAVTNEHIVEKTLAEAGVQVDAGAVTLPEDKAAYTTYASDGTTLAKEYCSFSGVFDYEDEKREWSAVLSYDYAMANATGNLTDTVRIIYVYVTA